jgi:PAS domain S-box-containing protein
VSGTDATKQLTKLLRNHNKTLAELEKYKLLVESVQDYAIFMLDRDGYIQTWNKGAQKTKGYTADEIIGKHFSNFYPEIDQKNKKPEKELEQAIQFGRIEDEGWRVRKDGSQFWANVIITALYDEDGELAGFGKVTRNLTERKHQEDALRDANTQLTDQQQELKRLNASKDEFISLASHQLRTPATAIKQLLGIILEGFAGDVPEHLVATIEKAYDSNERMINIVNSLLKVAQIDAGKVVLRRAAIDINELVQDVITEQSDSIKQRQQRINFIPDPSLPALVADTQYLRMALENLVDNASKYTFENGTITVTTGHKAKMLTIKIKDNGVGIDKANARTLFEKFKRIPNDMSQKVAGSGLGLYWVKKVIELHHGTITVQSELGKGTEFTIYLPREETHE